MSKRIFYGVGDRVDYMSRTEASYDNKKLKGLLQHRIGIIKAIRRNFFGRKYYIVRAVKDGNGAMDVVRGKDIFGKVERKDKQNNKEQ